MSIEFNGLDKLQRQLDTMEQGLHELEKTSEIPINELITTSFLKEHSSFVSFDELLQAGNFEVNSQEDFESIPDDVFDKHISAVTDFDSWQDMLDEAASVYALSKLGF